MPLIEVINPEFPVAVMPSIGPMPPMPPWTKVEAPIATTSIPSCTWYRMRPTWVEMLAVPDMIQEGLRSVRRMLMLFIQSRTLKERLCPTSQPKNPARGRH